MSWLAPARLVARSWRSRVAVRGHSMAPTLREGDWLLVDPDAYLQTPPSGADLVLAAAAAGPIVKRVGGVLAGGRLLLAGDAPSTGLHDHTATVPAAAVTGRAWFRYWPPGRIGRVR